MSEREIDIACAVYDAVVVASFGLLAFGTCFLMST
ncbi:hypothetical protein ACVIW0_002071 [Bradyrhizobium sp. USDA 4454]